VSKPVMILKEFYKVYFQEAALVKCAAKALCSYNCLFNLEQ